nr:MAG TPA: hypothetical protein [Caudoviricetes sp.]
MLAAAPPREREAAGAPCACCFCSASARALRAARRAAVDPGTGERYGAGVFTLGTVGETHGPPAVDPPDHSVGWHSRGVSANRWPHPTGVRAACRLTPALIASRH